MLTTWLTAEQQAAFLNMPMHDRAHSIGVAIAVEQIEPDDGDLIVAALLHDNGKVEGRHRVRLIDRVAKVLLAAASPSSLERLAAPPPDGIWAGLVLAVHHPAIGAAKAHNFGCSERACWLIANHERAGELGDADLSLLARADNATR
jgi:hypothetical protein